MVADIILYFCIDRWLVSLELLLNNLLLHFKVFEKDNDGKMKRTMRRPLPSGRITIPHAVTWASSMGLVGTALLASKVARYIQSLFQIVN